MSVKLPAMFNQNHLIIVGNILQQKCSQSLTLSPKVTVIAEIER